MARQKYTKKIYEDNHHLNIMPTGMLRAVEDQDLINAKIKYYGDMYTKEYPKNWNSIE